MNKPNKRKIETAAGKSSRKKEGHVGASQSQLFGPLSIYNFQQKSARLARDISSAFFGKEDVLNVLLVLRDGCTEDATHLKTAFTRFYHPSFLTRYCFIEKYSKHKLESLFNRRLCDAEIAMRKIIDEFAGHPDYAKVVPLLSGMLEDGLQKSEEFARCSVVEWIQLFCADSEVVSLTPGTNEDWEQLVTLIEDHSVWQQWLLPQTSTAAFEKIVSVFSCLNYAGATPSGLDEQVFSTETQSRDGGHFSYPIVQIKRSYRDVEKLWISGHVADLYNARDTRTMRDLVTGKGQVDLSPTSYAYDDVKRCGVVNTLFLDFLDPFFMGQDHHKQHDKGEGFTGLALPLYDRWECSGPIGAFVGWIFITFSGADPKTKAINCGHFLSRLLAGKCSDKEASNCACFNDADQCRQILRANLNDYAESLAEYVLAEEIERYEPARDGDPTKHFRSRFHHVEGWEVVNTGARQLHGDEFFRQEKIEKLGGEDRLLHVRLDGECVVLRAKEDTILPPFESGRDEEYCERVAGWARLFWENLKRLSDQAEVGRAQASLAAYSKTAHQLRKLARHIHEDTGTEGLDALRQYFMITFLSPKNVEALGSFYGDVAMGVFGGDFMRGRCLNDLLASAAAEASLLYPLILKWHNDLSRTPQWVMPAINYPVAGKELCLWSHSDLLSDAQAEKLTFPLNPDDIVRTKSKAFFSCALIALWLNIFEHTKDKGCVTIILNTEQWYLEFRNESKDKAEAGAHMRPPVRSSGTRETLEYYIAAIPEYNLLARFNFPDVADDGVFITRIPIPKGLLYA